MALDRIPLTLVLLAAFPVPALAQSALDQGTNQTIVLDPLVMRARDDDGNAADRGTSEYVADAELDRARMGDLKDLFAGIASVSVGGAIPVAQKIFVNGVDMLNLAVTVDGVSQNNRIFHHVSANAFDPGLMKFVRVDAGVAAADAGPNALVGAVVMETVDASDVIETGRQIGGNVRLSYDDNGNTFGRSATLAGMHDGFEWLGYLKSATGDDYQSGSGQDVRGSAADMQVGLLKFAYEAPQRHRFELSGQIMQDDALRPYRANIGEVIGGRPVPFLRRYDTERKSVSLSYENTKAEGMWDPNVVIGWSEVDVNIPEPYGSQGTSDSWTAKLENRFELAMGSVSAGLDYYDRSSTYLDPLTPDLTESARNVGLFAQARLEPMDRLSLSLGGRYDRQRFEGLSGYRDTVSGLSGNMSVAYEVLDGLSLRGGLSSIFGGISLEDNYILDPSWTYAGLDPSRGLNQTLGFDYSRGDLTFDGEIFRTRVDDARGLTSGEVVNFDFESKGFNLGLGYGWTQGFLRASYAYSKVEVNGAVATSYDALDFGAPLGGVFALEVQHTLDQMPLTLGGSIEAAQRYDRVESDADQEIPGYGVLNLFAEYTPEQAQGVTIRAAVNNVFDKEYSDRATYGSDYSTVVPLREPGRSVSLVAALKF